MFRGNKRFKDLGRGTAHRIRFGGDQVAQIAGRAGRNYLLDNSKVFGGAGQTARAIAVGVAAH